MDLNYQVNVPVGTSVYSNARVGSLDATSVSSNFGRVEPFVLEYLEWATNSKNTVRLNISTPKGIIQSGISPNGATLLTSIRPDNIVTGNTGMWDVLEYNETTNMYKFRLRSPLTFPEGATITLENTGSSAQNAAIFVIIRRLS